MAADNISQRAKTPVAELTRSIVRLAGARSSQDVIDIIRATARQLLGCEGVSIIRREGDLCHYIEEDAIGPLWKGQTFPATACISGWAMLNRRTVVIDDISLDPRIPHELYSDTFVRAVLMVPVGSEESIGAIGAYWAQSYRPTQDEIETLEALAGAAATAIENVRLIAALSDALRDAELARDELKHRVKNVYMGAMALAGATLPREHARELSSRLQALAKAHELLDQRLLGMDWIDLEELVRAELAPYGTEDGGRFTLKGQPVKIASAVALTLGLVVNELATNALKHGSLSVDVGHVAIEWTGTGDRLELRWAEQGGPQISPAVSENTGSKLMRRLVEGQLKGRIEHRLERDGVICTIAFPLKDANSAAERSSQNA
jgi:two-component sensor histidine kinase